MRHKFDFSCYCQECTRHEVKLSWKIRYDYEKVQKELKAQDGYGESKKE